MLSNCMRRISWDTNYTNAKILGCLKIDIVKASTA